jgi:hypothetical protein
MQRTLIGWVALLAVSSALPPLGNLLMRLMLTQMLVQIPLLFAGGAVWAGRLRSCNAARWSTWNVQGASGLLTSAFVLAFWMTPIALDHPAAEWPWEVAKIASVSTVGFVAGVSWRLAFGTTRIFYVGNMLWMTVTVGMLYQESTQRYCNAYLWDDQKVTGRALVIASIAIALAWTSRVAALSTRRAAGGRSDVPF